MHQISELAPHSSETKTCPQCQKQMPAASEYITWCEYCDYNVNPTIPEESTPITRLYERLGERLGESLVENIKEGVTPTAWIPTIAAFFIATIVHMVSLGLLLGGLYCLFFADKNIYIYIAIVLLFGLSWVLRPRIDRLEKDQFILPRDEFPTLYGICEKISEEMNTKKVDGIIIDHGFNASITEVGFRRKVIVTVGLPLFSILNADERLSVLAHEIGHKENKDLSKSFYLGTAISTIYTWFDLLYPDKATNGEREDGMSLLEVPAYYFMKAISFIPYSLIYLLTFLLYRNKQVAEFKADLFEAEVTGTHTAIQVLEKLHYGDLFAHISRKVALNNEKLNLFTELKSRVANLPERERKRLKRKTELEKTRIDTTHPATHLRMNLLKAKMMHPKIKLTSLEASALQKELEKLEEPVQGKIIDEIKYNLYQW
ncbi:M48 family metallopeptidase [Bacillus litorisediminis]|uniref:M48 family metallopeptidase n=1 Tax=Bacillus litorisediminis TaxID=2922713 RepID=UPI001FAD4010|nr:M48 family metallopeptidase [Bacillus litorisediminis]